MTMLRFRVGRGRRPGPCPPAARAFLLAAALAAALALPAGAVMAPARPPGPVLLPGDRPVGIVTAGHRTMVVTPPAEVQQVIVQFRTAPLLARGVAPGLAPANRLALQREHDSVVRDLDRFARDAGALGVTTVRRSYQECFNGVALAAPRAVVARLASLPYVRAVFPDDSVHAAVGDDMVRIGADQVWSQYGITGQGVVVAIIDTGIDYTHPALGGGFGPGFRVVAGWDFVNDDPDPMDDNLHGTHVAGIVGANGAGLRGVAPDVTFHAYKVLDHSGAGSESDVIAGVERAVDPDQDPTTDDHVAVMNLSLAGAGNPEDPMAQAIDVASQAGVVCVCAAGNAGNYLTVGSPAAAAEAITVGATDNQDHLAYFTSRGPTGVTYALKPDVCAPGVAIVSSVPGGGTRALSGTSMAAPHVAGAAALLLQAHPDWTPPRVKAALMTTAARLDGDIVTTGAGRIDIPAAIAPGFLIEPGSLSIPRISSGTAPYGIQRTLTVTNVGAVPQAIALSFGGDPISGLTPTIDPPQLNLAPGDSATATLTLAIDPVALAWPDTLPYVLAGQVIARAGAIEHHVSFGFVRAIEIALRGDPQLPSFALLHDGTTERWGWASFDGDPLALIAPGHYEMVAGFLSNQQGEVSALIVKPNVVVDHDDSLTVARADASLPVSIQPVDPAGQPIPVNIAELGLWLGDAFALRMPAFNGQIQVSPIDPRYHLEWDHFAMPAPGVFQDSRGAVRGISQPMQFHNTPADLLRVPITLKTPPGDPQTVFHYRWFQFGPGTFGFTYIYPGFPNGAPDVGYVVPRAEESLSVGWSERIATPIAANADQPFAITPVVDVIAPGHITGVHDGLRVFDVPTAGFALDLDAGPPVWIGDAAVAADTLVVSSEFDRHSRMFMGPLGSITDGDDPQFRLVENGAVTDSGAVTGAGLAVPPDPDFRHALAPAGSHRLLVDAPPYTIGGLAGRVHVALDLGGDPGDAHLPTFQRINVVADGVQSDSLVFDAIHAGELRVDASDDHFGSIAAWWAPAGSEDWHPLGAAAKGAFVAALPDTVTGWIALRVVAEDASHNRVTWSADPAYHSTARVASVVRAPEAESTPTSVTLHWTLPPDSPGPYDVYRKGVFGDWAKIGVTTSEPGGRAGFADAGVAAGRRYSYALAFTGPSGLVLFGNTVIDVPGARPVLFGIVPNPGPGNLRVSFALGSSEPATLEVIDLAGRRLRTMDVGPMGAGEHAVDLGEGLGVRSGIYWIRLRQSGVSQVMRAAVVH